MDNDRIAKKVFLWDQYLNEKNVIKNWSWEVTEIMKNVDNNKTLDQEYMFDLGSTLQALEAVYRHTMQRN